MSRIIAEAAEGHLLEGMSRSMTHDRVQMRFETLMDAFLTADRRRRGVLAVDRVLELYSLYFHSASGELTGTELSSCTTTRTRSTQAKADRGR